MSVVEKLLARMRRNPRDWRIEDLISIADRLGIDWIHERTSHVIFRHPDKEHLSVPEHGPLSQLISKNFCNWWIKRKGNNYESSQISF
jgi:predicted RNA binding protein YcfA (HicA-like mRNA interferase family)